ncbi:sugar kinase [Planotetraspora thailandica]|uniref:Sugar kinase n=1 Tax=Planotetraspora thailandica TaxID=487172 RepID=A0A8J3XYB1_9ACTN|nr:1-phosphofructokinase family hexose kinase [Planotetraspora thailandica]GII57125.1 sugar kinase [Planotetraspora thailandica]
MILTVTLNLALDVTYLVGDTEWGGVNRVRAVHRRAGGKGVNVARVLAALGHDVLTTGLAGGRTGEAVLTDLSQAGVPADFTPVGAESRTTLVVSEPGGHTLFNEPGPEVTGDDLGRFTAHFRSLLGRADAVVLSGSLPPGTPVDFYATLATVAADRGVPAIVDADGPFLRHALSGRPAIVKPNAAELARAVAHLSSRHEQAELLREAGAQAVVVSLGAEGSLAVTSGGAWRARVPHDVVGNPTGAGDALVAGLALGLVEGTPWPDRLRRATALGSAAVAAPVAGDFDPGVYDSLRSAIIVEPIA